MQRKITKVRLSSKFLSSSIPLAKSVADGLRGAYASKTVVHEDAIILCKLTPFDRSATVLDATEIVVSYRDLWLSTGVSISDVRAVLAGSQPSEVSLRESAKSYITYHKSGIPYEFKSYGATRRLELGYSSWSAYESWLPAGAQQSIRSMFYIMGDR